MGFPTAFLSSFTLTTSILYLSLLHHQNARLHQAALLRQQSHLLNALVDSPPPHSPDYDPDTSHGRYPPTDPSYNSGTGVTDVPDDLYGRYRRGGMGYRLQRGSVVERWKDMWNRDVEGVWRWVLGTDMREVREGLEKRVEGWREGERRV
jgi:altered-inheritance-of-mitochondria protein 5